MRLNQPLSTRATTVGLLLKAGIDTRNTTFNKLIDQIERVALRSTAPILDRPTGAGKSFLAKRIYQLRQSRHRVAGKLVAVNCATLRGDNAMSTLFGHVKGAFTGALTPRMGLLREADGGVLFLDEIAELGLDEQAMLLKAIEEKRSSRLARIKRFTVIFSLSPVPTAICASGWRKEIP
jgi:transcriptional regulatory protein RtcR